MKGGVWIVKDGKKVAAVRGADGKLTEVKAPTKAKPAAKSAKE